MQLATSTNIMDRIGDLFGAISPEDCIICCKECGFDTMDYNFCDQGCEGRPMAQDSWKEYLQSFKAFADSHGVLFSQAHLHIYDPADTGVANHEWEQELLKRSLEGTGILRSAWAVAHPLRVIREGFTHNNYLQANLDFYGPMVERAKQLNFGISFENMIEEEGRDSYCCNAEDLVELVKAFHMPNVGVNWDFGHANISAPDQTTELKKLGKWLVSTHIADNFGDRDAHVAPYYGNINWEELMRTLARIGYEGNFTYEVHAFTSALPRELRESQVKHLVDIGRYLIAVYDGERAKL